MLASTPSLGNSLQVIISKVPHLRKQENLRKGNLETLLDLLQDLLILVGADKGDGKTLGTESTGTTDSVKVRAGIV